MVISMDLLGAEVIGFQVQMPIKTKKKALDVREIESQVAVRRFPGVNLMGI